MKRTISAMSGKGVIDHNRRAYVAENVDASRTGQNIEYCYTPIRQAYHDLFDEALAEYNAKQKRNDRKIEDYYEKICSGKQEKPFYEVIFQIGNKDDMAAETESGELAKKVLNQYMEGFQQRNPNLYVFSAHLHCDEATPHLHIDFIPFTTGSKRGLSKRVSLKRALADQGIVGEGRSDTERSKWVQKEKEVLAEIMLEHGIEWEQKGEHREHLSVLEYKREQREMEVAQETEHLEQLEAEVAKKGLYSQKLDRKISGQEKVYLMQEEVENMGLRSLFGKVELTQSEAMELKTLAKEGIAARTENMRLRRALKNARQDAKVWKTRYEQLWEQTKEFVDAMKRAPERVKAFLERLRGVVEKEHKKQVREHQR